MKESTLRYEIRIDGHLAPHRLRHFEGLTVRQEASGETVISGSFRGQAALYGLLSWLQRLGVTLLLVRRVEEPLEDGDAGQSARHAHAKENER
jgi:hypothetical protein